MVDCGDAAAQVINMSLPTTKILVVEDNPGDARLIKEMLADAGDQYLETEWAATLAEGLKCLDRGGIDLVLLDLSLPDSRGLDTFLQAYAHAPNLPFVLLTGLDDETLALKAVREGAQDYLVKGKINALMLLRAIRYAAERKQSEAAIEAERKKLFKVLNNLPAFVYLLGEDFKISFANRRFQEAFGEPGDRPCFEVIRGREGRCEDCLPLEVLKTKVPQMFEWTAAASGHSYEIYAYPFFMDDKQLVLSLGLDVTDRKQAEANLRESEENLRYLATQLLTAQEMERKRISGELHDELGHALVTLKSHLKFIERQLLPGQVALKQEVKPMLEFIDKVVGNVRRLYLDLSPGDVEDLGLTSALKGLIEDFAGRHQKIEWTVDLENIDNFLWESSRGTIIYRLLQEALTNIGKHAKPKHVTITLKRDAEEILLTIADDGIGFNLAEILSSAKEKKKLGLVAMEERMKMLGGSIKIWSRESRGTTITLNIPIQKGGG